MSLSNDGRDIGQLLSYALRPKTRPGAEGDYGKLLRRYQDELAFREAFDAVLDGLDLYVLHAGDLGIVLTARRESIFAYRLSGDSGTSNKKHNALRGLAHLGIVAYAYPHPDDLHDTSVRYVDVVPCEAFIRRACTHLRTRAEDVAQGGEATDRVTDLALAAGLDTAWAEWDAMPAVEVGTRGKGSGRISTKCATYWVLRACRDLVDYGLARPVGRETDGRYQLLERFRHHVSVDAAVEGYQALSSLARVDEELPDPRDQVSKHPLPGRPPAWGEAEPSHGPNAETGAAHDRAPNAGREMPAAGGDELASADSKEVA